MEITVENKSPNSPLPPMASKPYLATQISLRVLAAAATLAASWLVLTSKQTAVVYGIKIAACYSYSPAYKFFAVANVIALAFSVLSLLLACITGKRAVNPTYYFYLFLHDLIVGVLLISGCAAATAIGYVGKYGNSHIGWTAICDHFAKFCKRMTAAMLASYLGFACYLILTVISAKKST